MSSCQNDPMFYLKFIYKVNKRGEPDNPQVHWMLLELPKALQQVGVKGRDIIDIGCGPTISNAISLSACFQNLYLSEYQAEARDLVEKWFRKRDVGFDWTPYFKTIENATGVSSAMLEKRLRDKFRCVTSCDINKPKAGLSKELPERFDAVFSASVIAVSVSSRVEYEKALANVVSLIRPGGYFIYNDLIQASREEMSSGCKDNSEHCHEENGKSSSSHAHHGISLSEEDFRKCVERQGLEILYFNKKVCQEKEYSHDYAEFLLISKKS